MLSALICTRNESRNIKECLNTLRFADEVIIIDDNSDDDTVAIAQAAGAKVFSRAMNSDWAAQRNFGLKQCTGDWILVIDADERVEPNLAEKIREIVQDDTSSDACYQFLRVNHFQGKSPMHGPLHSDWVGRLFRAGADVRYEGRVHEKLVTPYTNLRLHEGVLHHYPYDDWDAYFRKINRYAELMALRQYESGKQADFLFDVVLRPWWAFFKMYVLNKGFLDGQAGFVLSVNYFFYTMTKYVRLRELCHGCGKSGVSAQGENDDQTIGRKSVVKPEATAA